MPTQFVVYCEARTGSYNLVSRLNSCSDLTCHGEIFKQKHFELDSAFLPAAEGIDLAARDGDPLGFLARVNDLDRNPIYGFKMFRHHLRWAPGLSELLNMPQVRRVVLWRDPLEVYASGLRARETNIWTYKKGSNISKEKLNHKVHFTKQSFNAFCNFYSDFLNSCLTLSHMKNTFVIHYKQLEDDKALAQLLSFLGSQTPVEQTSTIYEKQFRHPLEEGFDNWEELIAEIRHSGFKMEGPRPTAPMPEAAFTNA